MSELTVTVRDQQRSVTNRVHGGTVERIVAALSADPETIDELGTALARFEKLDQDRVPFASWTPGICDERWDAGVCIVDLAARLVVCQSTYSAPGPVGKICYHDGQCAADTWLSYHLSADWHFSDVIDGWQALAEDRRLEREDSLGLDVREVLYGQLCDYLVTECLAAREFGEKDPIATIHGGWLATPREDLAGQSVRDVLLTSMEHLAQDMHDREMQWSQWGHCPPGIATTAAAYRVGGVGRHEWVIYYDLVRELLERCWEHVVQHPEASAESVTAWLKELERQWLAAPNAELGGDIPAVLIEKERCRLPLAVSGKDAMVDDDCPLCQMMAESAAPFFCSLDGCHMDNDFVFSSYLTREEWEREQREWEDLDRRFDDEQDQRKPSATIGDDAGPGIGGLEAPSTVWTRSYANPEMPDSQVPLGVVLFGLGAHLAELGLDLKETEETRPLVESLNRDFGNLRETMAHSVDLVEPVVERFCENLFAVAELRPDLADKCTDLEHNLRQLTERSTGG